MTLVFSNYLQNAGDFLFVSTVAIFDLSCFEAILLLSKLSSSWLLLTHLQ